MTRKSKIILPIVAGAYALDRLTKLLIIERLDIYQSVRVVEGFFDITHVRNTGAAFSFLAYLDESYRVPFFAVTTLAAIGLLLYFVKQARPGETLMLIALALILGGALGNLTDRLLYGNVVDFIDWYVGRYHWPAFNIADSCITVGVVLLGFELFVRGKAADGGAL